MGHVQYQHLDILHSKIVPERYTNTEYISIWMVMRSIICSGVIRDDREKKFFYLDNFARQNCSGA